MSAYIAGLTGMEKVYFVCALFGGGLFILRMILMLIGADSSDADTDMDFDAHDADFDGDHGDMDDVHVDGDHGGHDIHADAGLRLLTFQGLTAFVMMFGLTGYSVSRSSGLGSVLTVAAGCLAGLLGMWLIAKGFAVMKTLQSRGTMNISSAIGVEGSVYLTIPPDGTGKVQIIVSGRLHVMDAISAEKEELKTGDRVLVTDVSNERMLVVKKS